MLRELTFPSDRLPALTGLANAFGADRRLGSYIAGHWKSHLPLSLLWTFEREKDRQIIDLDDDKVIKQYPTWSWASIPYSAIYLFSGITFSNLYSLATIVSWSQNASRTPDSSSSSRTIYTITIKGRLVQVSRPKVNASGLYTLKGPNNERCKGFRPDYPTLFNNDPVEHMLALQITTTDQFSQLTNGRKDLCLILVPSTQYEGCYERVGTIHAYWFSTRHRRLRVKKSLRAVDNNLYKWFEGVEKKIVVIV